MKLHLMLALLMAVVVCNFQTPSQGEDLRLVSEQSEIGFVGSKPDGKHKGGFKKFEVTAVANFEEPAKSSIAIEIDAASLWADDDKLANHLKSPDFFDIRNNPTISFQSTEIVPGEKKGDTAQAVIRGDLQMLGKTVAIEIPVRSKVTDENVELTTEFTMDRTKWGMTYGQGKIHNDVKVNATLKFKR